MEDKFLQATKAYLTIVKDECNLLIDHIESTEQITIISKYDLYNYLCSSHKYEFDIGEKKYYRHGNGMMVVSKGTVIVNWNFGCKSWWCGIDPFLMASTLQCSWFEEMEYYDGRFIKNKCEQYLQEKSLYYYKGQYYINMLKLGCQKPEFPINYDKVVVEYKGVSRTFLKCKSIDKFIRKSNYIYDKISELKNNYILAFYNNDIEVARVPYNDIAYPDSAVKIMNEEIIKPHIVEKWKM